MKTNKLPEFIHRLRSKLRNAAEFGVLACEFGDAEVGLNQLTYLLQVECLMDESIKVQSQLLQASIKADLSGDFVLGGKIRTQMKAINNCIAKYT